MAPWKDRRLELGLELDEAAEGLQELGAAFRGKHEGVSPAAIVLGDLEDAAAAVFLEIDEEALGFVFNALRGDGFRRLTVCEVILHP